jgi:hypothetical protein
MTEHHETIVELLINNGADVNSVKNDGWTPLHTAIFDGRETMAKLLIDNGANPFARTKLQNKSPVDFAGSEGNSEVIYLLEKAARRHQKGKQKKHHHMTSNQAEEHNPTIPLSSGRPTRRSPAAGTIARRSTTTPQEHSTTTTTKGSGQGDDDEGFVIWLDAVFDDDKEDEALLGVHFAVKYSETETLTEELESRIVSNKNIGVVLVGRMFHYLFLTGRILKAVQPSTWPP